MSTELANGKSDPLPLSYKLSLVGVLASLALILLAIVDFRRGFLFADCVHAEGKEHPDASLGVDLLPAPLVVREGLSPGQRATR